MKAAHRFVVIALILSALSSVEAASKKLVFDPATSEVSFTLDATMHTVRGTLTMTAGELVYDLVSGETRGEIVIDAASAETGNRKRDAKMHRQVLNSIDFPRIVFRAEGVTGRLDERGAGEVRLIGTIQLHGDTHPFVLPAQVTIVDDRVQAHAEFSIPYVEWGLEDPSGFLLRVGKTVNVVIEARGAIER